MPKVTLEFNLPEEQEEFETATRAGAYAGALHEVAMMIRAKYKYGDYSEEVTKMVEEIRTEFYQIAGDLLE